MEQPDTLMPAFPPPHCPSCACDPGEYDPFAAPGPPLPDLQPLPDQLYVYEAVWDRWHGSPAEIARLARRGDEWMDKHFTHWTTLPRVRWYGPTGRVLQQEFISQMHSVTTPAGYSGTTSARLADEIGARRSAVRIVHIESAAGWRSQGARMEAVAAMARVPLIPVDTVPAPRSGSSESGIPPQRIEIEFRTSIPAVRLKVVAAGPQWCRSLQREMEAHVAAGARARVWRRISASRLGVAAGALIGLAMGFIVNAPVGIGVGVLSAYLLGTAGDQFVRWAFPPLELVEDWERSRWDTAKVYAWQGFGLAVAIAAILLTIVFAAHSPN